MVSERTHFDQAREPVPQLTLFYDGFCPLCVAEMTKLRKLDKHQRLLLVDVQQHNALDPYPQISKQDALTRLHALDQHQAVLTGLDVTHAAWSLVGRGWLTAPLRWPVVKWVADAVYILFARHRYTISRLLTGRARCEQCELKQKHN